MWNLTLPMLVRLYNQFVIAGQPTTVRFWDAVMTRFHRRFRDEHPVFAALAPTVKDRSQVSLPQRVIILLASLLGILGASVLVFSADLAGTEAFLYPTMLGEGAVFIGGLPGASCPPRMLCEAAAGDLSAYYARRRVSGVTDAEGLAEPEAPSPAALEACKACNDGPLPIEDGVVGVDGNFRVGFRAWPRQHGLAEWRCVGCSHAQHDPYPDPPPLHYDDVGDVDAARATAQSERDGARCRAGLSLRYGEENINCASDAPAASGPSGSAVLGSVAGGYSNCKAFAMEGEVRVESESPDGFSTVLNGRAAEEGARWAERRAGALEQTGHTCTGPTLSSRRADSIFLAALYSLILGSLPATLILPKVFRWSSVLSSFTLQASMLDRPIDPPWWQRMCAEMRLFRILLNLVTCCMLYRPKARVYALPSTEQMRRTPSAKRARRKALRDAKRAKKVAKRTGTVSAEDCSGVDGGADDLLAAAASVDLFRSIGADASAERAALSESAAPRRVASPEKHPIKSTDIDVEERKGLRLRRKQPRLAKRRKRMHRLRRYVARRRIPQSRTRRSRMTQRPNPGLEGAPRLRKRTGGSPSRAACP